MSGDVSVDKSVGVSVGVSFRSCLSILPLQRLVQSTYQARAIRSLRQHAELVLVKLPRGTLT